MNVEYLSVKFREKQNEIFPQFIYSCIPKKFDIY